MYDAIYLEIVIMMHCCPDTQHLKSPYFNMYTTHIILVIVMLQFDDFAILFRTHFASIDRYRSHPDFSISESLIWSSNLHVTCLGLQWGMILCTGIQLVHFNNLKQNL